MFAGMYHVLLYYKLVPLKLAKKEVEYQREVCTALGLKGRILINNNGINGTVGGSKESIALYKSYMDQHYKFNNIDWKESTSDIDPFPKLRVRFREEIITTDDTQKVNLCARAKHVNRDTFHQWLMHKEDMVILDMRNDYEWEIGRFVGAVRPPMRFFRELKDHMDFYDQFKDKKIVMFCTGGIRCEPASAQFIARGFDPKNIYQLEGGIVKYAEKYGREGFYEGKCYVFDERIAVPVNTSETAVVVGKCHHCQATEDTYRNCANKFCNLHFVACDACNEAHRNTCSMTCENIVCEPANMRPMRHNVAQ